MKVKAIVAIMDFDDLSEETQWEHRREIASDVFKKYRNGGILKGDFHRKIKSIVDDDATTIPISEQIAHLKEIIGICRNFYYTKLGTRLHPSEIEYIT